MQTMTSPTPTHNASQPAAEATPERRGTAVGNFARHYAEMLAAMFAGMLVLGGAGTVLLDLVGVELSDSTELKLLAMAVAMSVPMVAWMRYRGHGWRPAGEMTASMFVPTFAAIGMLWTGVESDAHALLMVQHIAMFPAMLAVMLLRRDEYTGHVGR